MLRREKMEDQVMSEVKKTFAPEFINRLDEIIIFDELLRRRPDGDYGSSGYKLNEILLQSGFAEFV